MSNPQWTQTPTELGAYWYQYLNYAPDICWFNPETRMLSFTFGPPMRLEELPAWKSYLFGPLSKPPARYASEGEPR
jgi:hypothetical protein